MSKLIKRSEEQKASTDTKKAVQERKARLKTETSEENNLLTSVPEHMKDTMQYIEDRNRHSKNYVSIEKQFSRSDEHQQTAIDKAYEKLSTLRNI
jgi:hypothetical protein